MLRALRVHSASAQQLSAVPLCHMARARKTAPKDADELRPLTISGIRTAHDRRSGGFLARRSAGLVASVRCRRLCGGQ